ncbi:MAG: spore coat protein CotJB [Clostridia bacterium]|jgi:spore coat protein JB|nr:spore coat protein CotJB [Clostridia bacterium]
MNERNRLLQKLSAVQFAMWELHLYLDTHPCDTDAVALCKKHEKEAEMLRTEYTEKYGALKAECCNTAEWLSDPWPWDFTGGVC